VRFSPTFPGFLAGQRDFRVIDAPPQRNSIATVSVRSQTADRPAANTGTRRFSVIKAHLYRRRPSHLTHLPVTPARVAPAAGR